MTEQRCYVTGTWSNNAIYVLTRKFAVNLPPKPLFLSVMAAAWIGSIDADHFHLRSDCFSCLRPSFSHEHRRPANLENVFRGTFRVKKAGLAGKKRDGWHWDFFRSIQPTEINCVPIYTVARRFGRGTIWYFCEKSNGISVITFNWVICINVGAPRQRYKLRAQKIIRLRKKSGTFPWFSGTRDIW